MPDDIHTFNRPELRTRLTPRDDDGIPGDDDQPGMASAAHTVTRRRMASDDPEMSEARTSPDIMETLSPEEREDIEENAPAIRAALMKAVIARAEPGRVVVGANDDDDLEPTAMRAVARLDDSLVEQLMPRIAAVTRDDRRAHRLLGIHAARNLREPLRVHRIRPRKILDRRVVSIARPAHDAPRSGSAGANAPTYTRVIAELRAVHCLRITTPRDNPDEMVLGTVLVGASGKVNAGRSVDLGTFSNGDLFNYGELPLGQFSLRSTDGYPKHMYVLFKLVETDADGRETARDLTKAIGGLAQGIATLYAGALVGQTAGMLVSVIGGFFQGLIDEDEFPIVGKRLTLDHMHDLGGSVGPRERTGDIGGHGGKYRIGYRWLMGA